MAERACTNACCSCCARAGGDPHVVSVAFLHQASPYLSTHRDHREHKCRHFAEAGRQTRQGSRHGRRGEFSVVMMGLASPHVRTESK